MNPAMLIRPLWKILRTRFNHKLIQNQNHVLSSYDVTAGSSINQIQTYSAAYLFVSSRKLAEVKICESVDVMTAKRYALVQDLNSEFYSQRISLQVKPGMKHTGASFTWVHMIPFTSILKPTFKQAPISVGNDVSILILDIIRLNICGHPHDLR